jgi:hypothetical protein
LAVAGFTSANGKLVRIAVEVRNASGIFGKDFVSGGLRDYAAKYQEGYWITARSSVFPSNVDKLLREFIQEILGSPPITMPEALVSHLVVHIWDGPPDLKEEDLLAAIGKRIEHSEVVEDRNRIAKEKAEKLAGLEEKLEAAEKKLAEVKSRKLSFRRGEEEQWEARVAFYKSELRELKQTGRS